MKQQLFSLKGTFEITDEHENSAYSVVGSWFKMPKYFDIFDAKQKNVARLTHKLWSFLPQFYLTVNDLPEEIVIKKQLSFLKPKYHIEGLGVTVEGNIWDMNFAILKDEQVIGRVAQRWFKMTSTYDITVTDESMTTTVVALVVAIDYIKSQRRASAAASAN
ncbi:LURP-one-related/scramblase family protein [Leuconostoc rapi]|nr:hypothetical protein [Leuconostoc rapi]